MRPVSLKYAALPPAALQFVLRIRFSLDHKSRRGFAQYCLFHGLFEEWAEWSIRGFLLSLLQATSTAAAAAGMG